MKTIHINKRKVIPRKESPAKFYYAIFAAVAAMAWGFSQVPPKKPVQEVKPVVLYKPVQKAKMMLYKPKTEAERQKIVADIWGIKKDGNIHQLKKILQARK